MYYLVVTERSDKLVRNEEVWPGKLEAIRAARERHAALVDDGARQVDATRLFPYGTGYWSVDSGSGVVSRIYVLPGDSEAESC